uniref:F-box domain-containing protein n=1 Tax=Macrostomum lignano TaxID=282301 RepID=A0A1I8JRN1_9PLAT
VRVGGRGRGACGSFKAGPEVVRASVTRPPGRGRRGARTAPQRRSNPSEQLPQALMIRILSELDQPSSHEVRPCGRAWHELVMQPLVWRRLHLYYDCLGGVRWLHRSEHCSGRLSRLQLLTLRSEHCEYYAEGNPLIAAVKGCPRLRCLRVLDCDSLLTPDTLSGLLTGCPRLDHLELDDERKLFLSSTVFSDAAACAQPFCKPAGQTCWLQSAACRAYRSCLRGCLPLLISWLPAEFQMLFAVACRLRSLQQMEQCSPYQPGASELLLSRLAGTAELRLRNCQQLGAEGYLLASGVATLTELELNWPSLAGSQGRPTWPASPAVRSEEAAVELQRLAVSVHRPGTAGLAWPPAGTCGLTNALNLTHLTVDLPCHDELLPALLTQLPRLRCLRLADCSGLTSRACRACQICGSGGLCRSLTDEALANLCDTPAVRGLRHLELHSSRLLGPVALPMIAEACPWLAVLELKNCRMHAAWLAVMFHPATAYIRLSAGDY